MALARTGHGDQRRAAGRPVERGLRWLLGMQNRDGGWAAFDRDINREVLTKVPFADHNAMLDPSCPDITARVLEALGHFGYRRRPPAGRSRPRVPARRRRSRAAAGSAAGASTTSTAPGRCCRACERSASTCSDPMVRRAVAWLKQVQQAGGGWGESCRSYDDPVAGRPGHADRLADGLGAARPARRRRGATAPPFAPASTTCSPRSEPTATGSEEPFTGTGFPKVFYLKYHLYRLYFPLMALARYRSGAVSAANRPDSGRRTADGAITQHDSPSRPESRLTATEPDSTARRSAMRFPLSLTTDDGRLHRPQEAVAGRSASRWC